MMGVAKLVLAVWAALVPASSIGAAPRSQHVPAQHAPAGAPVQAAAPGASASHPSDPAGAAPADTAAAPDVPAPEVPSYGGSLAQGLKEMEALCDAEKYDEALHIGDQLLAPNAFLRWKARAASADGWKKTLVAAADPLLDAFGWNGAEPSQRAAVHYARGVVSARAGQRAAAESAFESARSLAGAGELRRDAIYDLGTLYLLEGEERRAEIPEISGQAAPGSASIPGMPPGVPPPSAAPGAGPSDPPPDPLELAKAAYKRARGHLVERLREDWRDADARANAELVSRRLKELAEIEKKREEQRQAQDQQDQKPSDKQDKQDKQDPKDKPPEDDSKKDPKDGDKQEQEKPPEPKPEDQKPEEKDEKKPDEKPDEKQEEPKPAEAPAEQKEMLMTKEEVMRLLDRLKELEEKGRELQMQLRHARRAKVKKDW